jgi:hypothetical protein
MKQLNQTHKSNMTLQFAPRSLDLNFNSTNSVSSSLTNESSMNSFNKQRPIGGILDLPLKRNNNNINNTNENSSKYSNPLEINVDVTAENICYRLEACNLSKFKKIMQNAGYLLINGDRVKADMESLSEICELGSGTCGQVIKMNYDPSGYVMAVKQMRISGIAEENKRIIMDLDVVLKSHDCDHIVKCLGYFISESDVWLCMELMSMCFDKLLKLIKAPIPEDIIGKLTVAVSIFKFIQTVLKKITFTNFNRL